MNSEFKKIDLNLIRYSLVWESSRTLYDALNISPEDRILVITSAGCNVLNALLKKPQKVVAIDLNLEQNRLLQLKKHIILHHDSFVLRGLMGFDGKEKVSRCWEKVKATIHGELKNHWAAFFEKYQHGLSTAGKLENYLNSFIFTLNEDLQSKLRKLVTFDSVEEQREYFFTKLHGTSFQTKFIEYFDQVNLSKGRDPKLFKYSSDTGGATFYSRMVKQISSTNVSKNFYFRFLFFGPENLPEAILPPCYQKKNFNLLKEQIESVEVVTGEAIDYLLSLEGQNINKASLSNIFEYTDEKEFNNVCKNLFLEGNRNLQAVFWNLLQDHGSHNSFRKIINEDLSTLLSENEECFYFKNVHLLKTVTYPIPTT